MRTLIKLMSLLLLLSHSELAVGQDITSTYVDITQRFKVKKKYTYELQVQEFNSAAVSLKNIKATTAITFRILKEENGLKEGSWQYGKTEVTGADARIQEELNFNEGFEMRFLIDPNGRIKEIINLKACQEHIRNKKKALLVNFPRYDALGVLEALENTLSPTQTLIKTHFPEINYAFFVFGKALKSDSLYTTNTTLPNPLGGQDLQAVMTVKSQQITNKAVVVKVDEEIPQENLDQMIRGVMKDVDPKGTIKVKDFPKLKMANNCIYTYDRKKKMYKKIIATKVLDDSQIKSRKVFTCLLQ
ncbi:MAG: hypothetical protein AAF734_11935 [Bacteroidota bacterium]